MANDGICRYQDALKTSVELEKWETALEWAEKHVELMRICAGEDYPDYRKAIQARDKIKTRTKGAKKAKSWAGYIPYAQGGF